MQPTDSMARPDQSMFVYYFCYLKIDILEMVVPNCVFLTNTAIKMTMVI